MPGFDIVDRLKAASERDEGMDPAEAQALFIEAAEHIETLRWIIGLSEEIELEYAVPQGRA